LLAVMKNARHILSLSSTALLGTWWWRILDRGK
jgi:hypothetical protein